MTTIFGAHGEPEGDGTDRRNLLVVFHSRTGSTQVLCDAAMTAATSAAGDEVTIRVLGAFEAGPDDVLWAHGVLLITPANFGYMSGALKDFFERVYHPCLERTAGLPYALMVKGDTDVEGALSSVERIATGLRWRRVLEPVTVVGEIGPADVERVREQAATLAAGIGAGIF
ncbi:MAG TPA: flavodoxin [Acidimicrobiales bacterium]|nr:flavodoxin [Acidimicrobiales bacterium]